MHQYVYIYIYICFLEIVSQSMFSKKDVFSFTMDLIKSMLASNHTLVELIMLKKSQLACRIGNLDS